MGLFDFFNEKKKPEDGTQKGTILLAMPMFNNGETFELNKITEHLKKHWSTSVSDINEESRAITFSIQGETVAL